MTHEDGLRCDGPYGDHRIGERHYFVVEPDGRVKRFCDSDCLREHYALLFEEFRESLRQEMMP